MTFLDKKEQVLDIELTPYGKYLLSKGKWKPEYYEFYDDDVIYDSEYGGFSEGQDQIKERIKSTPRTKVQYTFESAEKRVKEYRKKVEETGDLSELVIEKRNNFSFLSLPLAKSSILSEKMPYTSIRVLNGTIESSEISTGSLGIPRNTKQVNLQTQNFNLFFREKTSDEQQVEPVILEQNSGEEVVPGYQSNREVVDVVIGDKIVEITKQDNYLLLDMQEFEVDIEKENFEFYLYEIEEKEEGGETVEVENQLYFSNKFSNVVNNILIEPGEPQPQTEITREFADYYFDFLVDKEIPINILCSHLSEEEIAVLNAEGYRIDCEQNKRIQRLENPELDITQEKLDKLQEC